MHARVGNSVTSSMIPPYPGSAARARDRAQALQAYFQPPSGSLPVRTPSMPSPRRSNGHRSMSQAGPPSSSSDQMNGFYVYPPGTSSRSFPEPESPIASRFHPWERDHLSSFPLTGVERESGWGGFHQAVSGPGGFRQRHGSERNPSQNRSWRLLRFCTFFYPFWWREKQTANIVNAAENQEKYVMCEVKWCRMVLELELPLGLSQWEFNLLLSGSWKWSPFGSGFF